MEYRTFSIKEALSVGWKKSGEHLRFLLGLFGIWCAYLAIGFMMRKIHPLFSFFDIFFISPLMSCGVIKIYYDIYTKDSSSYEQLYKSTKYYAASVVSGLYIGLCAFFVFIITAGSVFGLLYLCKSTGIVAVYYGAIIVSSIIGALILGDLLATYSLAFVAIVSDDAPTASKALSLSEKITRGHRLKLSGAMALSAFLVAISFGFLTSVIGIAWMHIYFRLKELHG